MKKSLFFSLVIVLLAGVIAVQAATTPKVPVKAIAKPAVKGAKIAAPKFSDKASQAVIKKATDFISSSLVSEGTKTQVSISNKLGDLYFLKIKLNGANEVSSAMTADGKWFFPTAMDVAKVVKEAADAKKQAVSAPASQPAASVTKQDKPVVEVFVMSYCPYGTQIEKGILPVAAALGSNIDFQIKFVDYAMHGDKEIKENLTQYCINKSQPDLYQAYLKCFLESADSLSCQAKNNIDKTKLADCAAATDAQYKITATAADQKSWNSSYPPFNIHKDDNAKYGVQGSPTLIINGQEASSGRDSASLAKVICAAFTDGKAPAACQNKFDTAAPAPGFGSGTTANSAPASCATN